MRLFLASGLWLVAALALLAAQQSRPADPAPAQQQPFRARVDVVSVDALVTDKQGQPVTNLTAADFEIKERGKLQTIDTFKFVDVADAAASLPMINEIHSDADIQEQAAREDVRVFVVFLDNYHVQRNNSVKVRTRIAQIVGAIDPRDLVAIMYPVTPITSLNLSHDRAAQIAQIEHFIGRKYDYIAENDFENLYCLDGEMARTVLVDKALYELSEYLGTLSERRKTVLYVSEGPTGFRIPPCVAQPLPVVGPCRRIAPPPARGNTLQPAPIQAAIEHNVAFYTLDPRGTAFEDMCMLDDVNGAAKGRKYLADAQEALRNLAYQTGGRAIVNVNEFGDQLKQMVRDSSAYYLLGYRSNLAKHDGQFHEISVHVKRAGVDVRARPGYWAWKEADIVKAEAPKSGPTIPDDVRVALDALAGDRPGAALRTWTGVTRGANGTTDVTLVWEAPAAAAGTAIDHVTIQATAKSGDVYVDTTSVADRGVATSGGQITFAAAPGPLTLRVVGLAASGSPVDEDHRDITVPEFTGTGPALSTPLVFVGRTVRELQDIRAAMTPRPTTSREFNRTDRLLVRVTAFGPAGNVPMVTMRLLNKTGAPLADLPAPTAGSGGAFDADVSLAALAPGDYLIELRASAETGQARALVAFRVGR